MVLVLFLLLIASCTSGRNIFGKATGTDDTLPIVPNIENVSIIIPDRMVYSNSIPVKVSVAVVASSDVLSVGARIDGVTESWTSLTKNSDGFWEGIVDSSEITDGPYTLRINATETFYQSDANASVALLIDKTPPVVSLTSPDEGFSLNVSQDTNTSQISLNATVSDSSLVNVSLLVDNVLNETLGSNSDPANTVYSFTKIFVNGSYSWQIIAYDGSGLFTSSESRNFTVLMPNASQYAQAVVSDVFPPNVSNPFSNSSNLGENNSISINVSVVDESNISKVVVGSSLNVSMINSSANIFYVSTIPRLLGCAEGSCILRFYAVDQYNNTNSNSTIAIFVNNTVVASNVSNVSNNTNSLSSVNDTFPPSVFNPRVSNSTVNIGENFRVSVEVNDSSNVSAVLIIRDGSNAGALLMAKMYGITFEISTTPLALSCPVGNCTIAFFANDSFGNVNGSTKLSFIVKNETVAASPISATQNVTSRNDSQSINQIIVPQKPILPVQPREPVQEQPSEALPEPVAVEVVSDQGTPLWLTIIFLVGGILLIVGIGIFIYEFASKRVAQNFQEDSSKDSTGSWKVIQPPPRKDEGVDLAQPKRVRTVLETYSQGHQKNNISDGSLNPGPVKAQMPQSRINIPLASLRKREIVGKPQKETFLEPEKIVQTESPHITNLKKFISDSLKLGYQPREVARVLIDKGWSLSDVQQGFKELGIKV